MADSPFAHVDLEASYGPPLAGVLLASFCCGLLIQQTVSYYNTFYRTDGWLYQTLVALLSLNALMSWGSNWAFLYIDVIVALKNPAILITTPGFMTIPVFSPIFASCCSEVFFVVRTWRLWNRKPWMLPILSIFPLGHLGIGLVGIIYQIGFPEDKVLQSGLVPRRLEHILAATFVVTASTDVVLTSLLIVGLYRKDYRENRGFNQRTDNVIRRLLRLSVTTAFITACLAVAGAVILLSTNGTKWGNLVDIIAFPVPHTTALVVVGTLNLRRKIAEREWSQAAPVRWTDSTGSSNNPPSSQKRGGLSEKQQHPHGSGSPHSSPYNSPRGGAPSFDRAFYRGRANSASKPYPSFGSVGARTSEEAYPPYHPQDWRTQDQTELVIIPAPQPPPPRQPVAVTLRQPMAPRDGSRGGGPIVM